MGVKELPVVGIVKFTAIIALQVFERSSEVSVNVSMKMCKDRVNIRFDTQGKSPYVMSVIIYEHKVIFVARNAGNGRRP